MDRVERIFFGVALVLGGLAPLGLLVGAVMRLCGVGPDAAGWPVVVGLLGIPAALAWLVLGCAMSILLGWE